MRVALVVLLAACGGSGSPDASATLQQACAHVCSCFTFSKATGEADCVTACVANPSSTGTGQKLAHDAQCYTCLTATTCTTIKNDTACSNECAPL